MYHEGRRKLGKIIQSDSLTILTNLLTNSLNRWGIFEILSIAFLVFIKKIFLQIPTQILSS